MFSVYHPRTGHCHHGESIKQGALRANKLFLSPFFTHGQIRHGLWESRRSLVQERSKSPIFTEERDYERKRSAELLICFLSFNPFPASSSPSLTESTCPIYSCSACESTHNNQHSRSTHSRTPTPHTSRPRSARAKRTRNCLTR